MTNSYEIWSAGDGYDIPAVCHGVGKGENFHEACKELFTRKNNLRRPFESPNTLYNEVNNTYYGCHLFHNHVEAQSKARRSRPVTTSAGLVAVVREGLDQLADQEAQMSCSGEMAEKSLKALVELAHRLEVAEKFVSDAGWEKNDGGFS